MDQVAQIREKIDIVSFISEFTQLKKAGRNFKANCPFHNEKTPSFMVSPERQIWHCFGCQKGGDVYAFLMEYERLEFPEALRLLAKRAGIELVSSKINSGIASKKERMYQINSLAKEFYHYILTKHPVGKRALVYLQNRGIEPKIIETFALGFAPGTGDALVKYLLQKKKFPKEEIIDAGLGFQKGSRVVDFFRGRLIFPLFDHRDNVVGFSGRILEPGNIPSKYINTRETLVYHKGDHVYGLHITKEAMRRENQVILVEGEFDVLSCFQNGIGNVIGVKGTALTDNQVNLISRFVQKITFCFDGDNAGQNAIKRSLAVVEKKGLTPTVIEIPGGKDPDEALSKEPGVFKKAVREDSGIYDYLLEKAISQADLTTIEGKKQVSLQLLPVISHISNEIVKEHYIKKISNALDTSYESIVKEMQRLTIPEKTEVVQLVQKAKRNKEEVLEEYLLALILQSENPDTLLDVAIKILSGVMAKDRAYQKIMHQLFEHVKHSGTFNSTHFAENLSQELVTSYNTCLLFPLPVFESEEKLLAEVKKVTTNLKTLYIHQRMKELALQMKQKEQEEEDAVMFELQKQYSDLAALLEKR